MIELLKHRFLENMVRHPNLDWAVEEKFLRNNPKAIQTLRLMEESGGEPDLLQLDSGEGRTGFVTIGQRRTDIL